MSNNTVQKLTKSQYLKLIGIDQWKLRETPEDSAVAKIVENNLDIVPEKTVTQETESKTPGAETAILKVAPNSATPAQAFSQQSQNKIVQASDQGLSQPVRVQPTDENKSVVNDKANENVAPNLKEIDLDGISTLQQLNETISNCSKCEISSNRTDVKFGNGDDQADLIIINIIPDQNEYEQGGKGSDKTSQLLDNLLGSIKLKRSQVFITNIVHCRPTDRNNPDLSEISNCIHFIKKQIELIQPKVILAFGELAAQSLLECDTPLAKLRGQPHDFGSLCIPLIATFHPGYLLRSPVDKAKLWDDVKFVRFLLSQAE